MLDENLIATLEQSLRQTRNAQSRLLVRLREVESESERLRQEIEALENSACQTEAAIFSLLATMRSGNQTWNLPNRTQNDETYDIPQDIQRLTRTNNNSNLGSNNNNNNNTNNNNNYRPKPVSYINNNNNGNNRNVPLVSSRSEPISNRFSDRTITQACSLLLRETNGALHVNELYNLLVSGGMEFTGNNPTISIAVSLNRNKRFRKVAPGTFDLVMRDASRAS